MNLRTPFESLQSSKQIPGDRGASASRMWTGRVVFSHRDTRGRLQFLFDVVPLTGWPSAVEEVGGASTAGRNAPLRGIVRVRLRQPFVGNLRNLNGPPNGMIVVPEIGSMVSVEMDEAGWIITGFHSGPIVAADLSVARLNEFGYNPGFEEALPSIIDDSRIPWLFGIDEGDMILARGDSRLKMRAEGVFIGAGVQCLHLYKTDTGEMFERYVEMQRRASGRMSYHRQLLGVNAKAQQTSSVTLPAHDALIINTDIIESSPYFTSNTPYVIRQRGHITKSTIDLGRLAGEVMPLPTEIANEKNGGRFCVVRDTVVSPDAPPTGTNADSSELQTTSSVVFDHQVGADGSFHIRAGNRSDIAGSSQLNTPSSLNFELAFDASTQSFSLSVTRGTGGVLTKLSSDAAGNATLEAAATLKLKGKQVIIESDGNTQISADALLIDAANAQLNVSGLLTLLQDLYLKTTSTSFQLHQHPYINVAAPAVTSPPSPTAPPPGAPGD